jgi:hypothetical protein
VGHLESKKKLKPVKPCFATRASKCVLKS